jgi:hypothetical protein
VNIPKPTRTRTGGKKSKAPDKRPARKRSWAARKLEKRKVKNLMKSHKMTRAAALTFWNNNRKGRVPEGYLKKYA